MKPLEKAKSRFCTASGKYWQNKTVKRFKSAKKTLKRAK
jgi:hypothetical protein